MHFVFGRGYAEIAESHASDYAVDVFGRSEAVEQNVTGVVVALLQGVAQQFRDAHVEAASGAGVSQRAPGSGFQVLYVYMHGRRERQAAFFENPGHGYGLMELHHAHQRIVGAAVDREGVAIGYHGNSHPGVGAGDDFLELRLQVPFRRCGCGGRENQGQQ